MRFVLALFKHETNTFSTQSTTVRAFSRGSMHEGPCYGDEAITACQGTNNAIAAYLDLACAAESSGRVLNASVFAGFPLADTPSTGFSIVLVADKHKKADAIELLDQLTDLAWQRREDFITTYEPYAQTLAQAARLVDGPVLLVDHGDNCASGGTTDEMSVLREMMTLGMVDAVAGPYWDPASVEIMIQAGKGAHCTLDLGGKTDMPAVSLASRPLRVSGTVVNITDGSYTVTGPMFTGMRLSLGRTAVLDTGGILIVVCEKPQEPFDIGIFTHAGIQPNERKFILIKSKQHFLAGFGSIAKHIVMVAGPGVCSSDFAKFSYRNLKRPIFPLDNRTRIVDGDELL